MTVLHPVEVDLLISFILSKIKLVLFGIVPSLIEILPLMKFYSQKIINISGDLIS